jgi:hypothetical protein
MAKTYRPGTYSSPQIIIDDTAEKLSRQVQDIGETFNKRKETLRLNKNAIAEEIEEARKSINDVELIESISLDDTAKDALMIKLDDLNDLMLRSIGRDQTEVIKKRREIEGLINSFGVSVGLMDKELELYKEAVDNGAEKSILNSTDPKYIKGFQNMINKGGAGWKMEAVGDSWVMKFTDPETNKDVSINMRNFKNAKENTGFGLIKYTKDKTEEYVNEMKNSIPFKQINTLTQQLIDARKKGDGSVVTETTNKLKVAQDNLRRYLETNQYIQASITEDDYQNYDVDQGVWDNTKEQRLATQNKVVSMLMEQAFPTTEEGKILEEIKIKEETDMPKPMTEAQRQTLRFNKDKLEEQTRQFNVLQKGDQDDIKAVVDTRMKRHLKFAGDAMKLPEGSKERADLVAKVLSEVGYAGVEVDKEGNTYFVVQDGERFNGVNTFVGIVDALNAETIYKNLDDKAVSIKARERLAPRVEILLAEEIKRRNIKTKPSDEKENTIGIDIASTNTSPTGGTAR